jgi:hypothetical protein
VSDKPIWPSTCPRCGSFNVSHGPHTWFRCGECELDGGIKVWNKRDRAAPYDAVYVGRGTPWGNPFKIGVHGDRDEVCDRFEREILPALDVSQLVGKQLLCWCTPLRCHADALLRKANALPSPKGEQA